jgi:hypothetical protein
MYIAHSSAFGALDHARTASLGKFAVQAEKRIAPAGTDGFDFAKSKCSLQLQNCAHVRPAQSLRAFLKRANLCVRQRLFGALAAALGNPERSIAVRGIVGQSLLSDVPQYDDALVVREYPFDGEDAASPQRIATHHRDHVDSSSTEFHGGPQS